MGDDDKLVITEAGFLTQFANQHTQRTERPFCFILGAGVSRVSGISTGGEMASVWLRELYEEDHVDGLTLEEWATAERLEIEGFKLDELARFYPDLYRRKYKDDEQGGYAFLESEMEGKEPSYGYSVLSYLLSETSHRVVVTTNFDNLVSDALSIHSSRFPLVIGHDALAQYAAVELRRPLIAKIHGALGFSPKSQRDDISHLPQGWCDALGRILDRYTPIVIGYEGNDGSLMGFLKNLPPHIPDRVFWCVYAPNAKGAECLKNVSADVCDYVRSRRGRLVPISGFDQLMAKLLTKLLTKLREKGASVPDLYERLKERHRQRERNYDEQQRKLFEEAKPHEKGKTEPFEGVVPTEPDEEGKAQPRSADPGLSEAVSEIADSRKEKPWWVWYNEMKAAPDPASKETIYKQALDALPNSAELLRSYALFLERRGGYEQAEELYQRALAADPKEALAQAFYGDFLYRRRNNPQQAEEHYKQALEVAPENSYILASYADFLHHTGKDWARAEEYYEKAIKQDSRSIYALERFAEFLRDVRGNEQRAGELERLAAEIKRT